MPDTLEDVCVRTALDGIEAASHVIDAQPKVHPFDVRYNDSMDDGGWDSCAAVLFKSEVASELSKPWNK